MGAFTRDSGHVTALLALWYIHMLASDDADWWAEVMSDNEESDDEDPSDNYQSS